jgi:hypothetical protein
MKYINIIKDLLKTYKENEYSCAVEPLFRRNGNRVSGTWEPPL